MRVISGTARGTVLYTLEGSNTRPTLDRVKESLFNILQSKMYEAEVLDLFAGSGALGIEALSRGASKVTFCDHSKEAIHHVNMKTDPGDQPGRRMEEAGKQSVTHRAAFSWSFLLFVSCRLFTEHHPGNAGLLLKLVFAGGRQGIVCVE